MAAKGTWRAVETGELEGRRFRCLEGCGFCCTFQPEVSQRELALLRARFKPRPVSMTVGDGRTYLQLQNKCGACTLLTRRGCAAYDLRPAHCRYFPFHVHFGDRTEVYVNHTCRGVELAAGAHLGPEFEASVLGVAKPEEIREHEARARDTYAEFQRRARRAGAWGDADAVARGALARAGPAAFSGGWLEEATRRGGEPASRAEALEEALAPFHERDVTKRPFYLAPDLRWLTFEPQPGAPGTFRVLEMDEAGALIPAGEVRGLDAWQDLSAEAADALQPYLRRLAERRLFAGSVYALVDDHDYGLTVEQATWLRLAEVAADLVVRARVLLAMGTSAERLADETARFYDSAFLDSPTIGGFL